jgi:predicted nuclease of restriction endonuclease-like RecB superfamily
MRFSLQDTKKQIRRRGDTLYLSLHLLRPKELRAEIEHLIDYYEQLVGQPQRAFSMDEARACIADYRLANCLISTMSAWYTWQQRDWTAELECMGGDIRACLDEAGITSPVHLRLALFDYVNTHYQGFLEAEQRATALQAFAELFHLSVSGLEYLLALDSDDEKILVREHPQPPAAQDVAMLYNRWAFEATLFNASSVRFVIDCAAFEASQEHHEAKASEVRKPQTGVGAVIKRLTFLARKLGVYYDLAYRGDLGNALELTLYGPQEMTGTPQQYGMRLARLCRMLLDYGLAPTKAPQQRNKATDYTSPKATARLSSSAIVESEATVHFSQRTYTFTIDSSVLSLLPAASSASRTRATSVLGDDNGQIHEMRTSYVYDSGIEQHFAEAFAALEKSRAVDGWTLVREPEPLLLKQSIFIPDFAFSRASRRIYVEILGFWTPAYRERKIQKLQQLQERGDIVLAIPNEARQAFSEIVTKFPIVWYDGELSATEFLNVLRSHYDDFRERLAMIDIRSVREQVERDGLLPERACYEMLHSYRRSELAQAAELVTGGNIAFIPGIGLFACDQIEHLRRSFVEWLVDIGKIALPEALHELRELWPVLSECEDAVLEAILGLWPEQVHIQRTSIFDAVVKYRGSEARELDSKDVSNVSNVSNVSDEYTIQHERAKKTVRERRVAPKKREVREVSQGDLWG